jgi:hypothetical protein
MRLGPQSSPADQYWPERVLDVAAAAASEKLTATKITRTNSGIRNATTSFTIGVMNDEDMTRCERLV